MYLYSFQISKNFIIWKRSIQPIDSTLVIENCDI